MTIMNDIKTEIGAITAQILGDVPSRIENPDYKQYLSEAIILIGNNISEAFKVNLSHCGIHYFYWDFKQRMRIQMDSPVYFSQPEENVIQIWAKLKEMAPEKYHFSKIFLVDDYKGSVQLKIGLGEREESNDSIFVIPSNVALLLKNWLLDDLIHSDNPDILSLLRDFIKKESTISEWLKGITGILKVCLNDKLYGESEHALLTIIMSMHMTLLSYENNEKFNLYYFRVDDNLYKLGSFAGRIGGEFNPEAIDLDVIREFAGSVLSYITYWEGIYAYEKLHSRLKKIEDQEIIDSVSKLFNDYLRDILFIDPEEKIVNSIKFEGVFISIRKSQKTAADQKIIVVRLKVSSQEAFRFLYCEAGLNYRRIENYLETVLTRQYDEFKRVRLDIALDHALVKLNTLGSKTVFEEELGVLIDSNKINDRSIIYKYYQKHKDLPEEKI